MLTLEPAFPGQDREELLRQIAFEEPQPPRRLNKAIPADLETIVLKALEKNPAERYATAHDVADELKRFLADEPIRARRPTLARRLRKWSRRHKAVVAGLAALMLTTLVLGSAWAWWHHNQQAARQRETEIGVTAALSEARTLMAEGDNQLDNPARWHATVKLAQAALQRGEELLLLTGVPTQELEMRLQQIREPVRTALTDSRVLVDLEGIQLEMAAVKDGNFNRARGAPLYAALFRDYGVDVAAPSEAAGRVQSSRIREALLGALDQWWAQTRDPAEKQRVGAVLWAAEPTPDAFRARWHAALRRGDRAGLAQLAREPAVQRLPATAVFNLASDLARAGHWPAEERLLRAGQQRFPSNFWLTHNLGMVLLNQKPSRPEEAARYLTAAVALRSDSPGVYVNLGIALKAKGDTLARYNGDGSLDSTFGTGGKVQTSLGNVYVNVSDVAIANSKIVVLGSVSGQGPVVLRYNSNGSLDSSFGSGGKVVLDGGWDDKARFRQATKHRLRRRRQNSPARAPAGGDAAVAKRAGKCRPKLLDQHSDVVQGGSGPQGVQNGS